MIDETLTPRHGRPKDAAKREEIVTAATQLFMDNGYELTSMEAVARQAGVSKLTIYSHFADKKELFRAIVQRRCDKLGRPVSFDSEAQLPVEEALLNIGRAALSKIFLPDSIRLIRVVNAEAMHHPEIVQIYFDVGPRLVKTAFAELLQKFDRQGQLSIPDAERATEQFFSLLKGELLQRVLMQLTPLPDANELEEQAQATVAFFLAAYKKRPSLPNALHTEAL
jgi:TetR/AcrR family transcriptional repressor of mexJK operon